MARLSAENSIEHLAALRTPDQKGSRKTNRFKDFFKGGYSRANLSSGRNMSPPGASPTGGVENFKPGFEKVGLHPSERSPGSETFGSLPPERSRTLDLDEWEKLKEENKDLGHLAKMQLYKEREEMRKREDVGGDTEVKTPLRKSWRDQNEEEMEILGVEAGSAEAAMTADTIPAAGNKKAAALPNLFTQEHWVDYSEFATAEAVGKEESIRKACEGSSSESPSNVSANVGFAVLRQHSLRHSPPLDDLRASAQNQVLPDDSISNIGGQLEGEPIDANASVSPAQQILDAIAQHEFRFHRFGPAGGDIDDSPISTARGTHSPKLSPQLDDSSSTELPDIKIYKLGPWELDDVTARVIGRFIVPITYSYILFVKAMEGPSEFLVALWKLSVMALALNVLRRIRGWHKDGSSEVWFAPAEDLWQEVKQHCLEMITTLLRELAHAVATALQELEAEDDE